MKKGIILVLIPLLSGFAARGQYLLKADGVTDTYSLIEKSGFYTETSGTQTPDEFMCHPAYEHISQEWDEGLHGYAFRFDIHVDHLDGGRQITDGNKSELIDRQRNEIKCMSDKPGTVASDGETIVYTWKFKLPEGMKTTSEFCHIHQIKGMGSGEEVAHPVITFTCRTASSKQVLQVINVPFEGASNVNLAQIDLKNLLGKWIEAKESVTVGRHGQYRLVLTDVASGEELLTVDKPDIQIWRETGDKSTMRGKWGIYRSLGTDLKLKSQLRSETLMFADFEATKGEAAVETVYENKDEDTVYYDLTGRQVNHPTKGIYIQKGKKILIK